MTLGIIFKKYNKPLAFVSNPKNSQRIKICAGGKNSFATLEQMLETFDTMRVDVTFGILKGSRFVPWDCQGSTVM